MDTGPTDGTTDLVAQLSFSSPKTRVTFTCALDGGPAMPCASPVSYSSLAPGPHSFEVWPTDAFGNHGAAGTWSWTVAG